jgi:hypothetical protein
METHLFKYLNPAVDRWNRYKHDRVGLQSILSEDDFLALLRMSAMSVLDRIGNGSVVLEKTTDHVWSADLILRIIPDAWFIHLVRDPRAVTSSLMSAGRSWGSHWASPGAAGNARYWVAAVSAGREIGKMTPNYLELRYEDLLSDGTASLGRTFRWLELNAEPSFCEQAIETCTLDKLRSKAVKAPWPDEAQPDGFYRKGHADSWRDDLSRSDVRLIEYIAGDLMQELGYEPATSQTKPLSMILADAESALAARCAAVGRRWLHWIDQRRGSFPTP